MNRHLQSFLFCLYFLLFAVPSFSQSDYTSKVPRFSFGTALSEQKKQLKDNPLIKRFGNSRQLLSSDKHRPFYHFISPEGKLNDPNGLCFWKGNWHLFYQAYPPEDPRQHWGHAISTDLVHWQDLPYAIYPNPEQMVFSGSTWVEDNRVIAMYYGVNAGVMVAVSDDPLLLNWKKISDRAVIADPKPGEVLPYSVWDPNIWKQGSKYYSIIGGNLPDGPGGKNVRANFLFESGDLLNWKYLHPFTENDRYSLVGDDGSCPYFWPIGDNGKYILLYFSHKSGGKYLIGDYDKEKNKFFITDGGNFNHGPVSNGGVHAPSAFPDGKGGVIVIFNMNTGKEIGDGNYTELMTLPRLLTLDKNGKLLISPYGEIESLRKNKISVPGTVLPANKEIVLKRISGDALEINLLVDMQKSPVLEFNVLRSPGKEEYTRIVFYKDGGYPDRDYPGPKPRYSAIAIDNLECSVSEKVHPRIPEVADVLVPADELLNLRIFIDRSIVEVFVNNRQCVAVRAYPERADSKGVSIKALGSDAALKSLDAWEMDNIYTQKYN